MWNLNEDTCTVSGFYFRSSGTSMLHAAQRANSHCDDVMRLATLNVNDKRDATSVVFKSWVVQTACRRHQLLHRRRVLFDY
jgi:hypothetical protein